MTMIDPSSDIDRPLFPEADLVGNDVNDEGDVIPVFGIVEDPAAIEDEARNQEAARLAKEREAESLGIAVHDLFPETIPPEEVVDALYLGYIPPEFELGSRAEEDLTDEEPNEDLDTAGVSGTYVGPLQEGHNEDAASDTREVSDGEMLAARSRAIAKKFAGEGRSYDEREGRDVLDHKQVANEQDQPADDTPRPEDISIRDLSREDALELARFRVALRQVVRVIAEEVREAEGMLESISAQKRRMIETGQTRAQVVKRQQEKKAAGNIEAKALIEKLNATPLGEDMTRSRIDSLYFPENKKLAKNLRNRLKRRIEKDRTYLISQGWIEEDQDQ